MLLPQLIRHDRPEEPQRAVRIPAAHLIKPQAHPLVPVARRGAERAEDEIPQREDRAEVAVGLGLPRRVVDPMQMLFLCWLYGRNGGNTLTPSAETVGRLRHGADADEFRRDERLD